MSIFSKFTKKKETVIDSVNTHEAEGAVVYLVQWKARYGEFQSNTRYVAKAFLNIEDAKLFASSLKEAQKLLQNTEDLDIEIKMQK